MKRKDGDQTRRAILAVLAERHGVHKSELCRAVRIGWGNLSHHVQKLEAMKLVVTENHGRLLWVFDPTTSRADRDMVVALRPTPAQRLWIALGVRDKATIRTLSAELVVSKKVIRTHLSNLKRAGAIEQVEGHPPTYALKRKPPG